MTNSQSPPSLAVKFCVMERAAHSTMRSKCLEAQPGKRQNPAELHDRRRFFFQGSPVAFLKRTRIYECLRVIDSTGMIGHVTFSMGVRMETGHSDVMWNWGCFACV